MSRNDWIFKIAAGLLLSGAPSVAHAYCRSMSCGLGEAARIAASNDSCDRDVNGCVTEGQPLHWSSACIDYAVQVDGSAKLGIDADTFQGAVARAFAGWEGVRCPGGGSPRFEARFQGFVGCERPEFVCGDASKNVNVVMFRDRGWDSEPTVIGLTTPSGGTDTGLIVDADLELNSQDYSFDVDGAGAGAFALNDVLSHELGHFLGLDHSRVRGALMSADYQTLALSRELFTADDVAAICAAYPPGAPLDCAPAAAPAYDACQLTAVSKQKCQLATMSSHEKSGCSIRSSAPRSGSRLLLLCVGAGAIRRRRRPASGCRNAA